MGEAWRGRDPLPQVRVPADSRRMKKQRSWHQTLASEVGGGMRDAIVTRLVGVGGTLTLVVIFAAAMSLCNPR